MNSALVPVETSGVATAGRLYIVFKVGDVDYALAAEEVLQMESYTGATSVPGALPFVNGIIQLRGRVVPVVDLRARFGLPTQAVTLASRVVVVERIGRAVALLADTAREVVRIDPAQLRPPPGLVDDGNYIRAIAQLGNRTILVLDPATVIGETGDLPALNDRPPAPSPKETTDA